LPSGPDIRTQKTSRRQSKAYRVLRTGLEDVDPPIQGRVDRGPASLINVGILKYEYYTAVLVVEDERKEGASSAANRTTRTTGYGCQQSSMRMRT
jgi:hypothetical protein